jgi:predicted protein tyrosine phosphatase
MFFPQKCLADEPHQAIPGLYISSAAAARNKETLSRLGITHILIAAKGLYPAHLGEYNYMLLEVQDWAGEDLLYYFEEAIKFIDEGRKEGNVLVHCMAGVSRSASIVIAYIMHAEKVPFQVAFDKLKKARPIVHPNEAFKRQLEIFGRWTLGISPMSSSPSPPPPTTSLPSSSTSPPSSSQDDTNQATAICEEIWDTSMCKLLFRLEFLAGFQKNGIRKVVSGEDPHVILNKKNYQLLATNNNRPKPKIHQIKGTTTLKEDSKEEPKEKVEEEIWYVEPDDEESFSFALDTSEFSEKKEKSSKPKQSHSVWVWSCAHCGRYLFTPLNITSLTPSHYEIEGMEWMRELDATAGDLKCEKCGEIIGTYNWDEKEGLPGQPPIPVFKIPKSTANKQEVIVVY